MDLGGATLALLNAFVLKAAVLVLLVRLLLAVFGRSSRHRGEKLGNPLLRAAIVLLATSELACGVEVYVLLHSSAALTLLHSVASAAGMGLLGLGMLEALEPMLLRYGGSSCLFNRLCRGCTADRPEGCALSRVIQLVAVMVGFAAIPAFFADTHSFGADLGRFVLPVPALNAWYDGTVIPFVRTLLPSYDPSGAGFCVRSDRLVLEFRVYPAIVAALAGVGLVRLATGTERAAFRWLAVASGLLGYVWLELACYAVNREALTGAVMHEVAEVWGLLLLTVLLPRLSGAGSRADGDPSRG